MLFTRRDFFLGRNGTRAREALLQSRETMSSLQLQQAPIRLRNMCVHELFQGKQTK
jgi:hypothetical protein